MRKLKNLTKKSLSLLLILTMVLSLFGNDMNSFFAANTITKQTDVYVNQTSSFEVTIPKTLILDGQMGEGFYSVSVKGNLAAEDSVLVVPEDTFFMYQAGKPNINTTVTQTETEFTYAKGVREITPQTETGRVKMDYITAGKWSNIFNFIISNDINLDDVNSIAEVIETLTIVQNGDIVNEESNSLTLNKSELLIGSNDEYQLNAYLNGEESNSLVTWESSNPNITVENGVVDTSAAEVGESATITATIQIASNESNSIILNALLDLGILNTFYADQTLIATAQINVIDIEFSAEEIEIAPGESFNLSAYILPLPINSVVTWEKSLGSDIILSNNGNTTEINTNIATSNGATYQVSATVGEVTRSITVRISETPFTSYNIKYNLNGGVVTNPSSYNGSIQISLQEPTKENYNFIGWTGSNGTTPEKTVVIPISTKGNLNYTANWEEVVNEFSYTINVYKMNVDGITYTLDKTTVAQAEEGTVISPVPAYQYGFTAPEKQTITLTQNTIIDYYYTRNQYQVSLSPGTGIETVSGTGFYYYDEDVTIGATTKTGYQFIDWTGTTYKNQDTFIFKVPGNHSILSANAELITYGISYSTTVNGGSFTPESPRSYNVETDTFTLINPSDEGYTFIGWTGSNGTTPEMEVTIEKGTTGNLNYQANWINNIDTTYKVNYYHMTLDGLSYDLFQTLDKQGETGTQVTPEVFEYEGFTSPEEQTITITGDGLSSVNYYYERNQYTLSINLTEGISGVIGSGTYYYNQPIVVTAYIRNGYEFKSWTGNSGMINTPVSSFYMPARNVILAPITDEITYYITYNLDGGTAERILTYTERSVFSLNNPTKVGYTFIGWTGSNGTIPELNVSIKNETGNRNYTANWILNEEKEYTVNHYQMNTDGETYTLYETEILSDVWGTSVTPDRKTYYGFKSPGFKVVTINEDGTSVLDYYYLREKYMLYALPLNYVSGQNVFAGGTVTGSGEYYYDETIVVTSTSSAPGYTFEKWNVSFKDETFLSLFGFDGETQNPVTIKMPNHSLNLRASYTENQYLISYQLLGGEVSTQNPTNYNELSSFVLENPTKLGYTFIGWTGSNGITPEMVVSVENLSGDLTYTANWELKDYVISYNLNEGNVVEPNPISYNKESSFVLENPTKLGYTFIGWTGSNGTTPQKTIAISNQIGNLIYTANWELKDYVISYDLNEGNVVEPNPISYNKESSFVLENPTKLGYTFIGWTGSNGTTPKTVVLVENLSGDLTYTANWELKDYVISYNLNEGNVVEPNPISYNKESSFVLENPTKLGYIFIGWTGSNGITPEMVVSVENLFGDLTYTANWELSDATAYTVNHYQMKLDGITYLLFETESKSGLTNATVNPEFKIYEGFTSPELRELIIKPDGTAVIDYYYDREQYTVTLQKDAGINSVLGAGTYYYEQPVSLEAELKEGYEFDTWENGIINSNVIFTFPMTAGNLIVSAKSKPILYPITYDLVDGIEETNPTTYDISQTVTLNQPTKEGFVFLGWTGSNGITPELDVLISNKTGSLNYIANWEEEAVAFTSYDLKLTDMVQAESLSIPTIYAIEEDGSIWVWGNTTYPVPTLFDDSRNYTKLEAGQNTYYALDESGKLYGWGNNLYYQLGNGTTTNTTTPIAIASDKTFKDIYVNGYDCIAIDTDGYLWSWGKNSAGELGVKSSTYNFAVTTPITVPTKIIPTTTFKAVHMSGTTSASVTSSTGTSGPHTLAIATDGSVWSWGYVALGAIGNGQHTNSTFSNTSYKFIAPVKILTGNFVKIETTINNSAALTSDGTLYVWGDNGYGICGNGIYENGTLINGSTFRPQASPIVYNSGTKYKDFTFSNGLLLAIDTDGNIDITGISNASLTSYYSVLYSSRKIIHTPYQLTSGISFASFIKKSANNNFGYILSESGDVYTYNNSNYKAGEAGQTSAITKVEELQNITTMKASYNINAALIIKTDKNYIYGPAINGSTYGLGSDYVPVILPRPILFTK